MLTEQEILLERAPGGEQQDKGTQENSSVTRLAVSGIMVMGLVSGLSLANHSDSRVLLDGACLVQPRWMPERRILGCGRTHSSPFDLSQTLPVWWRLISFLFLTRTSCHKTTHANGYYGAWPGWAVSISVLPQQVEEKVYFFLPHNGIAFHLFVPLLVSLRSVV